MSKSFGEMAEKGGADLYSSNIIEFASWASDGFARPV